jgi:hypothetical protein
MDLAVMISHRNLIFSASQSAGMNEEIAKVYTVGVLTSAENVRITFVIAS